MINSRQFRGGCTLWRPFYRWYGDGTGQRLHHPLPERLAQRTQVKEGATERPWYCGNGDHGINHNSKIKRWNIYSITP